MEKFSKSFPYRITEKTLTGKEKVYNAKNPSDKDLKNFGEFVIVNETTKKKKEKRRRRTDIRRVC